MGTLLIRPVADNYDKQRTYQKNMKLLRRAIENEFFLEAIVIEYAMMEDRLLSFLRHAGLLQKGSLKISDPDLLAFLTQLGLKVNNSGEIALKNLSTKSAVIRKTLQWSTTAENVSDTFLRALKDRYEGSVDIQEMLDVLSDMRAWCRYRDEVIHALLNKNTEAISEEISEYCRRGQRIARRADAQVQSLKSYCRGNTTSR